MKKEENKERRMYGEENEGEFKLTALYKSNQHKHSGQH